MRGLRSGPEAVREGAPVKKLLVLVILIALGVAVAKKVRDA